MSLFELTLPLRRGLAGLRRRVRSLLIVLGISRGVVFAGVALLAFFGADYALRLPLSVRTVFLLALVAGTVVVLVRRLFLPLALRLSDELLATRVESAHPELKDRLRSSLAFCNAEKDPENDDSPELMRVVVEETARQAGSIRFRAVARSATVAGWAAGAGALLLLLVAGALFRPDLAATFAARSLLLRDVAWPRRTTLKVMDMAPGEPRRITLGRETTVQIRAEGSLPDRVRFTFWERQEGRSAGDAIDLTPSAEDPSLFAFTLKVYTSYEFTVSGGDDDREEVYAIEALTPPAILGIEMDATYPDYLGLPRKKLRGGGQRVPQGTKLRLAVRANMDLEKASISLGADEPRPLTRLAPRLYATDLTAERNVRYSLHLVGANGEENDPGIDSFRLQVIRDQPPSVRIKTPRARTERLASGVLLIAFHARDDHRVARTTFQYRINDEAERTVVVGEAGGDAIRILTPDDATPARRRGVVAIDLSQLRRADGKLVAKGDRLSYTFEAVDSSGRKRRTRTPFRAELVTEADVSQTLQGRQRELREAVRRAEARARDAAERRALARDAREQVREFRRWNRLAQAAQARVIDQLDAISRRVRGVLNLYVFNRLDDRSAVDQILPYYERHLLEPSEPGGVPFRRGLYQTLFSAMSERRIRVGDGHRKLIEMAELADRLAAEHGPRAYRALGRIANARSDQEIDAALADARAEQKTILEGLRKLARLMREWESYEGVVRWFKMLRDKEKGIVDELDAGKPK